jgi:hypothetical protein
MKTYGLFSKHTTEQVWRRTDTVLLVSGLIATVGFIAFILASVKA